MESDVHTCDVEKQVESGLNDLVARRALQSTNRMDINSLLNPEGESHFSMEASDKEIFESVMDARENLEKDGPVHPRPSCWDVLRVISTIVQYVSDLNDPVARKAKAVLWSLTRFLHREESCTMKDISTVDLQ